MEQYERGEITYGEAVAGQVGNRTRPLASTTQDYEKSWGRNVAEEWIGDMAWEMTSPAHDTLEGLATQDPALIGVGLGKTAVVGALGVIVKEGAPVVIEKVVEKAPVLGKDVRQLAGKALDRAKAVFEGATDQARRLLRAEIEFPPGMPGMGLGGMKLKVPPRGGAAAPASKVKPNRGQGGRGGGPDHAEVQQGITDAAGGRQEVKVDLGDTGQYRIVDNLDSSGRVHQVGDMRTRGGRYRPSSRERAAIEDVRKEVGPNQQIIYHDKRGRAPSLTDPDLQPDWKPAPKKRRKW